MKNEPENSGPTREELLRENARLRGDLLTIARRISHDLRTPLGGIATTSEVIREILEESSAANAALIAPILDSTDGMAKIIERVSFVLKASAKSFPASRIKMGDAVFAALERLESKILKSGATIVQPDSWPEINGVAIWLEVVWWNLLANALQHGKNPARVELGWLAEKNKFRFWASDSGGAIPPEKIAKLFQPFHSLHEADAAHGLGLPIVQRLMELQGGDCGYERATGGGRFYFTLPA
ncbi:MAG TPA: HAMP domain-containing sensor histidine kinase [Verrucomicrobiae bacterium]